MAGTNTMIDGHQAWLYGLVKAAREKMAYVIVCAQISMKGDSKNTENTTNMQSNSVIENIMTRASVRSYQEKAVEKDKIVTLLKAGMAAPSAVDKRPWHFVVVTDRKLLDGLAKANPNAAFAKKAPLAIVVCGDMTKTLQSGGSDFWNLSYLSTPSSLATRPAR